MATVTKSKASSPPESTAIKVKKLVRQLRQNGKRSASAHEKRLEHFDRLLDELGKGLPELPLLPEDFSREDIYLNHAR